METNIILIFARINPLNILTLFTNICILFFIVFITFQNISIFIFENSHFGLSLLFGSIAFTSIILIYRVKIFAILDQQVRVDNKAIGFLIFICQLSLMTIFLVKTSLITSDAINLAKFFTFFDGDHFTHAFIRTCPSEMCTTFPFYPISSLNIIKFVNLFTFSTLQSISFITAVLAILIIPLQFFEIESSFYSKFKGNIKYPVLFLVFNMTLLACLYSNHIAFLVALSALLFFINLYLKFFIAGNQLVRSRMHFYFLSFILLFLFFSHPTVLIAFVILVFYIIISFKKHVSSFFVKQFILSLLFVSFILFIFFSRRDPILNQIGTLFSGNSTYFFIKNPTLPPQPIDLIFKSFKLYFTNSFFNILSYLLIPIILFASFFALKQRMFITLILLCFLSLDFYIVADTLELIGFLSSNSKRFLLDYYIFLTYGNYYRLNFLKSIILFLVINKMLFRLQDKKQLKLISIYTLCLYLVNVLLTAKIFSNIVD